MTSQATRSIGLYRGGNPSTIEQLLAIQSSSVVNELKEHFGVTNNHDLAVRLAMA